MNEVSPTIYKHKHTDVRLQCALELGQDICIQSATSHRRRVQCTVQEMQCKNPYNALQVIESGLGEQQIGQDAMLRAGYSRIQGADTQTRSIHSSAMINIAE